MFVAEIEDIIECSDITSLMLFLVIFEGSKNGIFPGENIPFRQGNNSF